MKDKWRNYAIKDGKVSESYFREYINRKKVRKTSETSSCHSFTESRQEETKEIKDANGNVREEIGSGHKRSRRDEDIQRSIVAMRDIPRESIECRPKSSSPQRISEGLSKPEHEKIKEENEIIGEEIAVEAHCERQQGIQITTQRRSRVKETDLKKLTEGKEKMKKEKVSAKEKRHEAKEGKKYEKIEDKREAKKEAKKKANG